MFFFDGAFLSAVSAITNSPNEGAILSSSDCSYYSCDHGTLLLFRIFLTSKMITRVAPQVPITSAQVKTDQSRILNHEHQLTVLGRF